MSFKTLCEDFFGSSNFYEILGLDRNASDKEVKKAYHRMSLLVHPDRVSHDQKEIATEKFKALGKIHSILQNPDKRKLYDEVGEFDEDMDTSFNWIDYWRKMFKKIEIKDIQEYEKQYIGSDTELRDIKKAYLSSKGDMNKILEMVPFSSCDSEPRIIEIVQKMVDDGEVESYRCFFNESKVKKMRRRKKWEKEQEETKAVDYEELEKLVEENSKKRAANFATFISDMEEKYGSTRKRKCITDGATKKKKTKK